MITNETITGYNKFSSIMADIRVSPESLAELVSRSQLELQERAFEFATAYLRYLASQHTAGAYLNGNMEIAQRANEIREGYGI
jgi:hypothetical protein